MPLLLLLCHCHHSLTICLLGGFVFFRRFILNPDYFSSPVRSTDAQTVYWQVEVAANGQQGKSKWLEEGLETGLDAS